METNFRVRYDEPLFDPFRTRWFTIEEDLGIEAFAKTPKEFYGCFQDFQIPLIVRDLNEELSNSGFKKAFENVVNKRLPPTIIDPYFEKTLAYYIKEGIVLQTLLKKEQHCSSSAETCSMGDIPAVLEAYCRLDGNATYTNLKEYTLLKKALTGIVRKNRDDVFSELRNRLGIKVSVF